MMAAKIKIRHKTRKGEDYQIPGSPTLVHFDKEGIAEIDEGLYAAHFRNTAEYQVVPAEHVSEPAPATKPYRAPTANPKEVKATKEEIAADEADRAREAAALQRDDSGRPPVHVVIDEIDETKPPVEKPSNVRKAKKPAKKTTKKTPAKKAVKAVTKAT